MVQRYAHLAPSHLAAAVERLVSSAVSGTRLASPGDGVERPEEAVELGRNLESRHDLMSVERNGVS
jgi:hypothetical protein